MSSIIMNFSKSPSVLPTYWQALTLKRKGVKENDELPTIEGMIFEHSVNKENLVNYLKLCLVDNDSCHDKAYLPILYPHVMAGVLHLHIMTHPKFPINLLGAIHKYNTVHCLRPIRATEKFHIRSWIGAARYLSNGVEFDLHTEIKVNNELVWYEISTYFKRRHYNIHKVSTSPFMPNANANKEIAIWKIGPWLGKRYASVSKDFNPIHINKYLAKMFGFKKDLAHGMCVAAQALNQLSSMDLYNKTIKIYFKGPSYLGSHMSLKEDPECPSRYDLFTSKNKKPVIAFEIKDNS